MIGRVRGELVSRDVDRVEVRTASGVTYEVYIPLTVFRRLPAEGATVELRTEYRVKDDVPNLYGFSGRAERALFRLLQTVQMVGPRLAMSMLSTYDARRLARAIAQKDVPALVQVNGLGKKTASRLILELADKVRDFAVVTEGETADSDAAAEAVTALVNLGYGFTEADSAVREATQEAASERTEDIIRHVLSRRTRER